MNGSLTGSVEVSKSVKQEGDRGRTQWDELLLSRISKG